MCASGLYVIPDSGCRLSCVGKEELWNEILISGGIAPVPECDRDEGHAEHWFRETRIATVRVFKVNAFLVTA